MSEFFVWAGTNLGPTILESYRSITVPVPYLLRILPNHPLPLFLFSSSCSCFLLTVVWCHIFSILGLRETSVVESTYCPCRRSEFVPSNNAGQLTTAVYSASRGYDTHFCYFENLSGIEFTTDISLSNIHKIISKSRNESQTPHKFGGHEYNHASSSWEALSGSFCHHLPAPKRNQHSASLSLIFLASYFIYVTSCSSWLDYLLCDFLWQPIIAVTLVLIVYENINLAFKCQFWRLLFIGAYFFLVFLVWMYHKLCIQFCFLGGCS